MPSAAPAALPSSPLIVFLRWVLPALVCAVGIGLVVANGFSDDSLEGGAAIIGAGLSISLMNVLWRVGVSGDRDRDEERAAREFFDRTGRWPDEGRA